MMSILYSRSTRFAARVAVVVMGTLLFGLLGAMTALAQQVYPPPVEVSPEVVVEVQPGVAPAAPAPEAGLAFTGAELTLIIVAFGALLAAGTAALIAARRRAARNAA
jgi:hypothetical protein